jgi:glycosyltransferase involved in cell wall biosynthesis
VPYAAKHPEIDFMNVVSAMNLDPLFKCGFGAYDSKNVNEMVLECKNFNKKLSIREIQHYYCEFIEDYLKNHTPEVVHAHDWLTFEAGVIAKKEYGLPLVAHVHATEFDRSGMHGGNPVVHAVEREGLLMADKIIAVSKATKKIIHDRYGIPWDKIDVAYNSLDEGFVTSKYAFESESYKYISAMKQQGYTIVSTVGRFTVQKGLTHMMHAAARAISKEPKLLFVFAGDGEQRNELMRLAADLHIINNVIFTGFVRGKKLRDIYEISDVFVMSSISEPFGLTALEAAHHGNVLILTKQSGVAEVLKSVMEYDFWDEEKLADEIIAVAHSKVLKHALQNGISHEYRKISWDDIAKKCLSVYNEVRKHKRDNF